MSRTGDASTHEPAIEPDLPIVDPHHHLWITPPFAGLTPFPIEQLADERAESGHDVRATVFVDCQRDYLRDGPEEMRVIGETRAVEAMRRGPSARAARCAGSRPASSAAPTCGSATVPRRCCWRIYANRRRAFAASAT